MTNEKKHSKELTHESERAAQIILNAMPYAAVVTDETGNITHSNAYVENMFGYQVAELSGRPIETIIPELILNKDIENQDHHLIEYYNSSIELGTEFFGQRKDHTKFPVTLKLSHIDTGVCNWEVMITIEDISGDNQTEKEIHQTNTELKQYADELETINHELGAFCYSITHDLKSPLRAMASYINILTEDYEPLLDADGKQICEVISSEARRMSKLLDGLMTFSQLGRSEIRMTAINMNEMVNQVFNELTRTLAPKNIDFRISDLPPAMGDPLLIYQMWTNLVSNAVKFTSKKENPVIEISASQADGETTYIIRDNGAGFDMKNAGKLFGIFERLHGEREFEGTGTGLAIVHRIVQRHCGRIRGEGERGNGAAFYITLPAIEEA